MITEPTPQIVYLPCSEQDSEFSVEKNGFTKDFVIMREQIVITKQELKDIISAILSLNNINKP